MEYKLNPVELSTNVPLHDFLDQSSTGRITTVDNFKKVGKYVINCRTRVFYVFYMFYECTTEADFSYQTVPIFQPLAVLQSAPS